jgi:hypothetical protein
MTEGFSPAINAFFLWGDHSYCAFQKRAVIRIAISFNRFGSDE